MKLFNKIVNIYNNYQLKRKQKRVFRQAKPGDIIYAKTPGSKKQQEFLARTHHLIRPMLVIEKGKDYLTVYTFSSSFRNTYNNIKYLKLPRGNHLTHYLLLDRTYNIPISELTDYKGPSPEEHIQKINHQLKLINDFENNTTSDNHSFYVGDIVKYNKRKYLIYNETDYGFELIKLYAATDKPYLLKLDTNYKTYFLRSKKRISLSSSTDFTYVDTISLDQLNKVYRYKPARHVYN